MHIVTRAANRSPLTVLALGQFPGEPRGPVPYVRLRVSTHSKPGAAELKKLLQPSYWIGGELFHRTMWLEIHNQNTNAPVNRPTSSQPEPHATRDAHLIFHSTENLRLRKTQKLLLLPAEAQTALVYRISRRRGK